MCLCDAQRNRTINKRGLTHQIFELYKHRRGKQLSRIHSLLLKYCKIYQLLSELDVYKSVDINPPADLSRPLEVRWEFTNFPPIKMKTQN